MRVDQPSDPPISAETSRPAPLPPEPGRFRALIGGRTDPPSVEKPGPALDALLWTIARATAKKGG